MSRLTWSGLADRGYETGLDRGVLYLNDGTAVPWNGLTSVDEDGGDSAVEFYMDGRPFLYLPKPKEYKATLSAYTYPDEFSALMGVEEISDGMYLDGQGSDTFSLSYRVRIGNAADGDEAGYKIHIIYNATAVVQSYTSATLTESVNPNEFSWDIQAFPVAMVGHRPTAHYILDTRHMDEAHVQALENVLYGTDTVAATLPGPQVIHDLLNFGGAITITDNGDGTWTADGSYFNVYLLDADTFEIDNVNAIGHGDGTYDISSTP